MSEESPSRLASELRRAFDAGFARPLEQEERAHEELLGFRLAGQPHAIRLREIAGIVGKRPIVPVPSHHPELLGLSGVRGSVVPIFDLAALLGYPRAEELRWVVLCGREEPLGLAFSALEKRLRVDAFSLHGDSHPRPSQRYVREVARRDGTLWAVISIPLVEAGLRARVGPRMPTKEQ